MLSLPPKFFLAFLLFIIPIFFHFRDLLTPQSQLCGHKPTKSPHVALQNKTGLQPMLPSGTPTLEQTPIDQIPYGNAGPKIRQVSMLFGGSPNEVDDQSLNTHIEHGKRWGYPTHILRQNIIDSDNWLEFCFSKPSYMLSLVINEMAKPEDERAEWLVWFDSDTIIMNPHVPWATFLPPADSFPDIHIVGAKDWNSFNPGVFLIRVDGWSVRMLTQVFALKQIRPDIEFGNNADQDAMIWVMDRPGYREHVIYQPIEWFQGYQDPRGFFRDVQPGDLLVHFPGWKEKRFKCMDEYLDKLRSNKSDWHIELHDTGYPASIDAYWSRLRDGQAALQKADAFFRQYAQVVEEPGDPTSVDDPIITLGRAETELRRVIEEEAYKPTKLLEATSRVVSAVQAAEDHKVGNADNLQAGSEGIQKEPAAKE